jgi:hypothetical protein
MIVSRTATYVFIGLGLALYLFGSVSRPLSTVNFQNLLSPEDVRRF